MQTLLIEMNKTCCFYRDECDANSSEMDLFIKEIEDFSPIASHSALSFSINTFRDKSVHRDCLHFILIMLKELFITKKFKSCIFHTNHSQKIYLEFFIFQPIKIISLNVFCLAKSSMCVQFKCEFNACEGIKFEINKS